MRNKKAMGFAMAILAIFTIVIFIWAAIILNNKIESNPEKIGKVQYELILSYDKGENTLFYIDESAKQAAYTTLNELSDSAGLYTKECGEYFGYKLLLNINDTCIPEQKNPKNNFQTLFNHYLDKYLQSYGPVHIPTSNYRYDTDIDDKIKIEALAVDDFAIPIIERKVVKKAPKIEYKIPADADGMIKQIVNVYGAKIRAESKRIGADDKIVVGVIATESSGRPALISASGCVGLMQFCHSTAKGYSEIFTKLTMCKCTGNACQINPLCNENNDDRFSWEKSIEAGTLYLLRLMNQFSEYSYQREFALASYNGGTGVINAAIKRTGKSNPSWGEVAAQIDESLINEIYCKTGCGKGNYFYSRARREGKVTEIINYVNKVSGYILKYEEIIREDSEELKEIKEEETGEEYKQCCVCSPDCRATCTIEVVPEDQSCGFYATGEGMSCAMSFCSHDVKSIGDYTVNPSFSLEVDYDLKIYTRVYEALEKLAQVYETSTNKKDFAKNILDEAKKVDSSLIWTDDCDDFDEKVFYAFAEEFYLCANSTDNNCYCEVKIPKTNQEVDIFVEKTGDTTTFSLNKDVVEEFSSSHGMQLGEGIDVLENGIININQDLDTYQLSYIDNEEGEGIKIVYSRKDFDTPLLLYKNNNAVSFLNPSTYNEKLVEYSNGDLKQCNVQRDTVKLCVDTGVKVPRYDDKVKKIRYENNKIRLAYYFRDNIPPPTIFDFVVFEDIITYDNEVLLAWSHKDEEKDAVRFNIYYSVQDFFDDTLENIKTREDVDSLQLSISQAKEYDFIDISNPKLSLVLTATNNNIVKSNFDATTRGATLNEFMIDQSLYSYTDTVDNLTKIYTAPFKLTPEKHYFMVTAVDAHNNELKEDKNKQYIKISPKDNLAPATWPLEGFDFNVNPGASGNIKTIAWATPTLNVDGTLFDADTELPDQNAFHIYIFEQPMTPDDVVGIPNAFAGKTATQKEVTIPNYESSKNYCFYVVPTDKNGNKQFNEKTMELMTNSNFFRPKCI
ncbi:transglycosylase SLT domain-containing protein [Candidatus Woesearchaeota archaeon]|nr:transglycosylase SLT domain-containing protein [Candidatus Woesearchaeota archaeon]